MTPEELLRLADRIERESLKWELPDRTVQLRDEEEIVAALREKAAREEVHPLVRARQREAAAQQPAAADAERTIQAPWTEAQVTALNRWQETGHPYTCGNCRSELVPTVRGWVCMKCDYTQTWAHDPALYANAELQDARSTIPNHGVESDRR